MTERPETTIPTSAAIMRALGAWLAPGSGHDEQDTLVRLIVAAHAHPDYHPAPGAHLGYLVEVVVGAVDDERLGWHVTNGIDETPCANRLGAHGPLLETPPAMVGDTLCVACRAAETARAIAAAGAEMAAGGAIGVGGGGATW